MKILLVVGNYYGIGGTQVFVRELAKRMIKRGHDVNILSHTKLSQPRQKSFLSNAGYRVFFTLPSIRIPKIPFSYLIGFFIAPQLFFIKSRKKYDIIQAQSEIDAFSALILRRWHKIPISCRVSGVFHYIWGKDLRKNYKNKFWVRPIIRYLKSIQLHALYRSNGVSTITDQQVDILDKLYGFPRNHLDLVYHGIDTDLFSPKTMKIYRDKFKESLNIDGPILVFTGRFSSTKRVGIQILALKEIVKKFPNIKLVLFGVKDNYSFNDYFKIAKDVGVDNNLVFGGSIPYSKIHQALSVGDIYLDTSFPNGLGFSQLEALACGIPLVTVLKLDDPDSFLVSVEPEPKSVANAIISLLNDSTYYKKISKLSRDFILKNHSWDVILQKYEDHFQRIINNQ
ncbi:MAG: glycosyltransferase family 4 protein [Candidatus Hodarchaeales archaeon]